jgi:dTDP-4-amino-4,6-dideoxygalactose transaminase
MSAQNATDSGIETMKNEYPFSPEYPKPQNAKGHEATTLRIPCYENLTDKEQNEVIKKIKEFYGK